MTIWLTSDTHFGHKNIIRFCSRNFTSTFEMDKALIANWNRCVKPDDTIWHLGDFALCSDKRLFEYIHALNGKINIVLGNHDKVIRKNHNKLLASGKVESIQDYKEFNYNNIRFVLMHYGMRVWPKSHFNRGGNIASIHTYAHSHGKLPPFGLSLDIGVDSTVITTEYRPVSIDEIIKWAEKVNAEVRT